MAFYCGRCGAENPEERRNCEQCGVALETASNARLTAVVLNELTVARREGALGVMGHERLQTRYRRRLLDFLRPAPAYEPAAPAPAAAPPLEPAGPSPSLVPSWLVDQAPNLLLYLGAFLVVMAGLVFASTSRETMSGGAQVALLGVTTVAFLGVGWLCYRFPPVRVAGYTFIAVGALLVPLNFAAAYNFVLEEEGIAGDVVWLWASIYSSLFYIVLAVLGLGLLYGFMAQAGLVSAVAAAIAVTDLPPEWAPPVFVGLAIVLLPAARYGPERIRSTFGIPSVVFAHFLIAASIATTFYVVPLEVNPAAMPVTLAAAACFLAVMAAVNAFGLGRFYASLALTAVTGALAAGLVVLLMPLQWIPPVFAGLALALLPIAWWAPGRLREQFAAPSFVAAHVLAIAAAAAGAHVTVAVAETDLERTALPVTLALVSAFFVILALWRKQMAEAIAYCGAALTVGGGMLFSIVFVLDKTPEFYSVALAGIAALYALGALAPFRRRLFAPELLWPFAVGSAFLAWLPFLDVHDREPWFGAGATWGAAALFAVAALFAGERAGWLRPVWREFAGLREEEKEPPVDQWVGPLLLLPCAAAIGMGYYRLLQATEVELAGVELALRYLPLALGFAAVGAVARLWRRKWSPSLYAISIGYSIFVLVAAHEDAGLTAVLMTVFAGAAALVVLIESVAVAAYLPLAYALFAVIFALVHFEPRDEVWPLPFVGMALVLYAAGMLMERPAPAWAQVLRSSSLAVALFAPCIGYGLLAFRADEAAENGQTYVISEPPLYLWSMGAVAVLGLLVAFDAWRRQSLGAGYVSSVVLLAALLLGIGHFRPENPQPYVVPIGLHFLLTSWVFSPRIDRVAEGFRELVKVAEVAAAVVLLGTTFMQTFDDGTTYRFVLLGETIAYLAIGLLLRRRLMVVPGLAFGAVAGTLFAFERQAEGGLPPWAILALVGVFLIGAGFLFLMRRDYWERAQRAAVGWWQAREG